MVGEEYHQVVVELDCHLEVVGAEVRPHLLHHPQGRPLPHQEVGEEELGCHRGVGEVDFHQDQVVHFLEDLEVHF